jgi:hypothetical protein
MIEYSAFTDYKIFAMQFYNGRLQIKKPAAFWSARIATGKPLTIEKIFPGNFWVFNTKKARAML